MSAKEFQDELKLLLRGEQSAEEELTEEQKLMNLAIQFDPYSTTRIDDYEKLKEQVSKVNIAGILAKELEKSRIDPMITKQALSALRVLDKSARTPILRSLLQPENLATLAPVFPRLMTVLRTLYRDLDEEEQLLIDQGLLALITAGSHITQIDLNLAYLIQVLRQRSIAEKESIFIKIFRENASPLVRREIILAMADWRCHYFLTDLTRRFASSLSKWERCCFIIASYVQGDEGAHWRSHNSDSFDLLEKAVRDWFSQRWSTNKMIP